MHEVYPMLKYLCCCCVCLPSISGRKRDEPQPGQDDEEEPLITGESTRSQKIMIGGKEVKKRSKKKRKNPI